MRRQFDLDRAAGRTSLRWLDTSHGLIVWEQIVRRDVDMRPVLLPSGLGLKLDNVDVGRAGFVRCLPNGCVAEVVMDDKLLGQLRTAKTATFIIFETPEEGIGFPLSLNGIGEGYDKLP